MPYDHRGHLVEAVDCVSCNSSLEWHGRLPEDPNDVVCTDCRVDQLTARAERAEAEVLRLVGALLDIEYDVISAIDGGDAAADVIARVESVLGKPPRPYALKLPGEPAKLRPTAAQPKEPT